MKMKNPNNYYIRFKKEYKNCHDGFLYPSWVGKIEKFEFDPIANDIVGEYDNDIGTKSAIYYDTGCWKYFERVIDLQDCINLLNEVVI